MTASDALITPQYATALLALKFMNQMHFPPTSEQGLALLTDGTKAVLQYLHHPTHLVRFEAARACCHIMRNMRHCLCDPLVRDARRSIIHSLISQSSAELASLRFLIMHILPSDVLENTWFSIEVLTVWRELANCGCLQVQRAAASLLVSVIRFAPTILLPRAILLLSHSLARCEGWEVPINSQSTSSLEGMLWLLCCIFHRGDKFIEPCISLVWPFCLKLFRSDAAAQCNPIIAVAAISVTGAAVKIAKWHPDLSSVVRRAVDLAKKWSFQPSSLRAILIQGLHNVIVATGDVGLEHAKHRSGVAIALYHMLHCSTGQQHDVALRALSNIGSTSFSALSFSSCCFAEGLSANNRCHMPTGQSAQSSSIVKNIIRGEAVPLVTSPLYLVDAPLSFECSHPSALLIAMNHHSSYQDEIEYLALNTLLRSILFDPKLRPEAVSAMMHMCNILHSMSTCLRLALEAFIRMLCFDLQAFLHTSTQAPMHFPQRSSHSRTMELPMVGYYGALQHNGVEPWPRPSGTLIMRNVIRLLKIASIRTLCQVCTSNEFKQVLNGLCFQSTGMTVMKGINTINCSVYFPEAMNDSPDCSPEIFKLFFDFISILHSRVSVYHFTTQLGWLLPAFIPCLSTSIELSPTLQTQALMLIDCVQSELILTGYVRQAVQSLGEILDRLCRETGCISQITIADTYTYRVLVILIRLIAHIKQRDLSREIAHSMLGVLVSYALRTTDNLLSFFGTPSTSTDLPNHISNNGTARDVVDNCGPARNASICKVSTSRVELSELAIRGIEKLSRTSHCGLTQRMRLVDSSLACWMRLIERVASDSNFSAIDTLFIYPEENICKALTVARNLCTALNEYNQLTASCLRGEPTPAHSWECGFLSIGMFDDVEGLHGNPRMSALCPRDNDNIGSHELIGDRKHSLSKEILVSNECIKSFIVFDPDIHALTQAWSMGHNTTSSGWFEWIRRGSVEMLRQSPSAQLRPCATIAEVHEPLAYLLFNSAYLAAWIGLGVPHPSASQSKAKLTLTSIIHAALSRESTPPFVLRLVVELVEYMHIHDTPLPVDVSLIVQKAIQNQNLCCALAFSEIVYKLESQCSFVTPCIDMLLSIQEALNHRNLSVQFSSQTSPAYGTCRLDTSASCKADLLQIYALNRVKGCSSRASDTIHSLQPSSPLSKRMNNIEEKESRYGVSDTRIQTGVDQLRASLALFDCEEALQGSILLWKRYELNASCLDARGTCLYTTALNERELFHAGELALTGAQASWALRDWSTLDSFLCSRTVWFVPHAGIVHEQNEYEHWNLSYYYFLFKAVSALESCETHSCKSKNECCGLRLSRAHQYLSAARVNLANVVSSQLDKGYGLMHSILRTNQRLTEIEEVIEYRSQIMSFTAHSATCLTRQKRADNLRISLRNKWNRRMYCWAMQDPESWFDILLVRRLVFTLTEDMDIYLEMVHMCYEQGELIKAVNLLGIVEQAVPSSAKYLSTIAPQSGACMGRLPLEKSIRILWNLRIVWAHGFCNQAYGELSYLVSRLLNRLTGKLHKSTTTHCVSLTSVITALLLKISWRRHLALTHQARLQMRGFCHVRHVVYTLLNLRPHEQLAWQAWALVNSEICELIESASFHYTRPNDSIKTLQSCDEDRETLLFIQEPALESIRGFNRCLEMGLNDNKDLHSALSLQMTLRLLTLWFRYGHEDQIHNEMCYAVRHISLDCWLVVLPQLIARINHEVSHLRSLLAELLVDLAYAHPQAVIWPLTASAQLPSKSRRAASVYVLEHLRYKAPIDLRARKLPLPPLANTHKIFDHAAVLSDAQLVSRELNQAAISWHEKWFHSMESAASSLFGDKDVMTMLKLFAAVTADWCNALHHSYLLTATDHLSSYTRYEHVNIDTVRLVAFYHSFGSELHVARHYLSQFVTSKARIDLLQAWGVYSSIHRRVKTSFGTATGNVDLGHVAPNLLQSQSLHLVVPGTYEAKGNCPVILTRFGDLLRIMPSKQRPRRLEMHGSDGDRYMYLLKGHEDLRQDERVMQIFGLINTLTQKQRARCHRIVTLKQYIVVPLSDNSGLIGWVNKCSTIYEIISNYRARFNTPLDYEAHVLNSHAPEFEKLPTILSQDIFINVQGQTRNHDLSKMLWLTSESAEKWLLRRTAFEQSLALTSVSGYIIGLGDRHLSNIMLQRVSGQIVHIDFGDCFDVSVARESYPEHVPFRLTAQLRNCTGVCGIRGLCFPSALTSLNNMRENHLSLMAMLETFVYDPLVNWKLAPKLRNSHATLRTATYRKLPVSACGQKIWFHSEGMPSVLGIIQQKLLGHDFDVGYGLSTTEQFDLLVSEACSPANLCRMYPGWCPFL